MKKTILLLTSIIIFLTGCEEENNKHKTRSLGVAKKTLNIEIDKKIKVKSFDSILKKKRIIKLETKPTSLISGICKIIYRNKKIYIIDWQNDYSVACFDINGNFNFKLRKIGRGPHEYTNFIYGDINDYSGDIELITNSGRDFIIYDSLGKFKKKMKLPYSTKSFCSVKDKRYFYKGFIEASAKEKFNFRIFSMDYDGGNLEKYLPYKVSDNTETGSHYLYGFSKVKKGEYRFFEKYNDTIYKIDSSIFTALYKINFNGYENNKPFDFLFNSKKYANQNKIARKLKIPSIFDFNEFDNYIVGVFSTNFDKYEEINAFIFDKKNKKTLHNSFGIFLSDKIKVSTPALFPKMIINGLPSSYVLPTDINGYINHPNLQFFNNKDEIKIALSSYFEFDGDIDANPYIIQYKPYK